MRNFVIAILVAILITYSFGHVATERFDIRISIDEEVLTLRDIVLLFDSFIRRRLISLK